MATGFTWSPLELDSFVEAIPRLLKGDPCLAVQADRDTRFALFRVSAGGFLRAVWRGRLVNEEQAESLWHRIRAFANRQPSFLRERVVTQEWNYSCRFHVRGSFSGLCEAVSKLAPLWQGDGISLFGRSRLNTRYRAVWTKEGHPFHFWRCKRHVFEENSRLVFQSPLRRRTLSKKDISAVRGWVLDSGLMGGDLFYG